MPGTIEESIMFPLRCLQWSTPEGLLVRSMKHRIGLFMHREQTPCGGIRIVSHSYSVRMRWFLESSWRLYDCSGQTAISGWIILGKVHNQMLLLAAFFFSNAVEAVRWRDEVMWFFLLVKIFVLFLSRAFPFRNLPFLLYMHIRIVWDKSLFRI